MTSCDPSWARSDCRQRRRRTGKTGWRGDILRILFRNLQLDLIINYLSAECNRLWNIAMDMLPGVFPGRLLNICRDCWESWEGWTFVVVVVVVGDTDPPAVNLAPLPSSFSSLAEESSTNDRSRLSGRPKRQRKRVRREFTWIKWNIIQQRVNVIVIVMAW